MHLFDPDRKRGTGSGRPLLCGFAHAPVPLPDLELVEAHDAVVLGAYLPTSSGGFIRREAQVALDDLAGWLRQWREDPEAILARDFGWVAEEHALRVSPKVATLFDLEDLGL